MRGWRWWVVGIIYYMTGYLIRCIFAITRMIYNFCNSMASVTLYLVGIALIYSCSFIKFFCLPTHPPTGQSGLCIRFGCTCWIVNKLLSCSKNEPWCCVILDCVRCGGIIYFSKGLFTGREEDPRRQNNFSFGLQSCRNFSQGGYHEDKDSKTKLLAFSS